MTRNAKNTMILLIPKVLRVLKVPKVLMIAVLNLQMIHQEIKSLQIITNLQNITNRQDVMILQGIRNHLHLIMYLKVHLINLPGVNRCLLPAVFSSLVPKDHREIKIHQIIKKNPQVTTTRRIIKKIPVYPVFTQKCGEAIKITIFKVFFKLFFKKLNIYKNIKSFFN